jgi:hypothetical protein
VRFLALVLEKAQPGDSGNQHYEFATCEASFARASEPS